MKNSTDKWIRIVLGLFLILYALNQFVHVLPTSYGQMRPLTREFLDSILTYLPFLYFFEMIVGVLLVLNKWTKLILIMLVPLSFSFLMFNLINQDISMMWPAIFVAILNIALLWIYRETYKILLE